METTRLILRQWKESDFAQYAKMCADPDVMKYFPAVQTETESYAQANRARDYITANGWGFWAVEVKSTGEFIGFVGLHAQEANCGIPFAPLIEVGWRLNASSWGNGYAPEAANAALEYAFTQLNVDEIYSFTSMPNEPSKRVMEKIGMVDTGQLFNHPMVVHGHRMECHCLFKMTKQQWSEISN
ncbi:MAG: GNAT family N-acetyltransferase [Aliivibrio sp.]|uniref:GNAT family N-acetyltransferase n=1 Tax=Aliivibrio sp. TaxID=1872443 RepID=UPI001A4E4007|nr:GNAT family N-acetyltransferase [Aliivibrio sp.]